MSYIGYSGQYLDNHPFRIKVSTGEDIQNATGNAVAGELFVVTGESPALYIAKETSTMNSYGIYKVANLTTKLTNINLMNFPGDIGE